MKDFSFRFKLLVPQVVKNKYGIYKERKQLDKLPVKACDASNLRTFSKEDLNQVLNSEAISQDWNGLADLRHSLNIPNLTLGVNPGDQRAIYHLIKATQYQTILEIGTHIGSSTVHLGLAIKERQCPRLLTVDIEDVNDVKTNNWLNTKKNFLPIDLLSKVGCSDFVEFKVGSSLEVMRESTERFDFIFLDGDHRAFTVYQELPIALKLLKPNGLILLHDYFPDLKPLWSNSSVTPGTCLAMERIKQENPSIEVLPFGALPWETKLGSNVTSLALVTAKSK